MNTLSNLSSELAYHALPTPFYQRREPQPLENPRLVIASPSCANHLDLDANSLSTHDTLNILGGIAYPDHWQPVAMKYFGHQFGYLNPDLGDGRGLLLTQHRNTKGELWDVHLKGAGTTAYSRGGDGRAVLRSSIREFLASEALASLGIATTRALAVATSDTPVYRETEERGATLVRVAKSHIRFGHFEFAYHSDDKTLTESLARYVIAQHFPCLAANKQGFADMFKLICEATARMLVDWQSIGFAHGVMNTDNMSIIGDTFDFGPYGFMSRFQSNYICNHSDQQGRYAFDRQPAIGQWNLSILAQALTPLISNDDLQAGIFAYSDTFNQGYMKQMRAKLGLLNEREEDQDLIFSTLQMLQTCRMDYSYFFREISCKDLSSKLSTLRDLALDIALFDQWSKRYQERLTAEDTSTTERAHQMQKVNPRRILRNSHAQQAIEAAEKGDYTVVQRLHQSLLKPFEDIEEFEDLAVLPAEGSEELEISCSS